MNAKQIADILVVGANTCSSGILSVERYNALNKALWDIARDLKLDKELDEILHDVSAKEMSIVMKRIS